MSKDVLAHKSQWFSSYQEELHADPYPFYTALLKEDPLFYIEERGMWVASRYADIQQVLKSPQFIREIPQEHQGAPSPDVADDWKPIGEMMHHWMLLRDPPDHTRLRGLVSHGFSPRAMAQLEQQLRHIASDLAADLADSDTPDLITSFAFPFPVIVIAELLGVPSEDRELFKEWSHLIAKLLDVSYQTPAFIQQVRVTVLEMTDYFEKLAEERRRNPQEDLISSMLKSQNEGKPISDAELVATCILLLVAGHETTVNLIGNGIQSLLLHPDQQELLVREPSLIPSAVEEMLRYEPPVQMTGRFIGADVEVSGRLLRKGQHITVLLAAGNRDPEQFADPNRFDIHRSPNRHLSFAAGVHFCLGAPLARMEGEIAASTLLAHYPEMRLAAGKPQYRHNILFRGLERLPILTL
ncbi:cytochrome P450 [Paenibacillus phyllosphaerae]|uniref:Cytochrome P450 n=1 Tax=Paenibacillus phyllosphaerae TaxID=274593 RepID=A0A7W5FKS9_9BACL|nr:cytochrome P450 [Paenibacillus phyllosphaerae]MBB3108490.1 cytochrome P450 [Paenibacillus phyllosphaerae]